jgi:hypothetical protein
MTKISVINSYNPRFERLSLIWLQVWYKVCFCAYTYEHSISRTAVGMNSWISIFFSAKFEARSGDVGFVVNKVALEQVFSEYFRFLCQFSFHRLLHTHHLSSGAGTIGQTVADIPSGLSLTPRNKNYYSVECIISNHRKRNFRWNCCGKRWASVSNVESFNRDAQNFDCHENDAQNLVLCFFMLLAWLYFYPWRWVQYFPPKCN